MKHNPPRESVLDRFLRYSRSTRSPGGRRELPEHAKAARPSEASRKSSSRSRHDASIDKYGYVTGTLPRRSPDQAAKVPVIGFIAHATRRGGERRRRQTRDPQELQGRKHRASRDRRRSSWRASTELESGTSGWIS